MEPEITIHTPQDSAIAAYGIAEPRHPWARMIISGIIAFILLFGTIFSWLLSRPLSIPDDTAMLFVIRPKTVNQVLSTDSQATLPEPWKTAIGSSSIWPIVFGAHQEDGVWKFFTLSPRWIHGPLGYNRTTHGLTALTSLSASSSTRLESYSHFSWNWFRRFRSYAIGELYVSELPSAHTEEQASSTVRFAVYKDHIQTDLTFTKNETNASTLSLSSNHDVSLDIQRLGSPSVASSLFHAIRWGDAELSQLSIPPIQLHLSFDNQRNIKTTELIFQEPLSSPQKQELLAHMRVVEKKAIRLPDGSYISERRFPTINENSSTTFESVLGSTLLKERSVEASYGTNTSTQTTVQPIPNCTKNGIVIARLSSQSLEGLLQLLSVRLPTELTHTGIQFIQQKNILILCKEK